MDRRTTKTRGASPVARAAAVFFGSVVFAALVVGGCAEPYRTGKQSAAPPNERFGVRLATPDDAGRMRSASPSASEVVAPDVAQTAALPETNQPGTRACSAERAAQWIAEKQRYARPDNEYQQIMQGSEYGPVEAIRTFYVQALASETKALGADVPWDIEFAAQREVRSDASRIVIAGTRGSVNVDLSEKKIGIGRRAFTDPKAISVFRTLGRLLADLGSHCKHQGIRASRYGTRAYREFIRIEVNYGPVVVQLEALSNGPANPERVYLLDLVAPKDSYFWDAAAKADTRQAP
jgi:hypothetical protein